MVSMLLYHLPKGNKYKVVFMKRNMQEMLASQKKMLERKGQPAAEEAQMSRVYEKHLREIEEWLAKQDNIEVLYVSYNEVLQNARPFAEKISEFLGGLDTKKMVGVVDAALYRQRKSA
jgi:hypothetical protein